VKRAFTAASPHSFNSSCRAGPLRMPAATIASFSLDALPVETDAPVATGARGATADGFTPRYSVDPRGRIAPVGATNSSEPAAGRRAGRERGSGREKLGIPHSDATTARNQTKVRAFGLMCLCRAR
jgi:hypothetical protein